MLRISTRGRYALRALVDIGRHQDEGPVLRDGIARRQEISANYAAQILRLLVSEGLVESVKGPGGGYRLAKPPEAIRAGDVLRAIEGPLALVHCVLEDDETPCTRAETCVTHRLWAKLSSQIEETLDSVTVKALMDESESLDPTDG